MTSIAVLIDGGFVRALARKAKLRFDPDLIEKLAKACCLPEERPLRYLYYDCAPYNGTAKLPVSGELKHFTGSDAWLNSLAARELFAVRRGVLKFRGFKPKGLAPKTDDDFAPDFEQKGVDMRIGLDLASFAVKKTVDRVVLVSGDTDCVPAMKLVRISGLQVTLVSLPGQAPAPELLCHADFHRSLTWTDVTAPV